MKTLSATVQAAFLVASLATGQPLADAARARVTFDAERITDIQVSGLADRAAGRAMSADAPARIASISKVFVAMGVMRLVEAGRLDLDRDVSAWLARPLRDPAFPDVPITLRLLLSHQSSLTDGADYLIPLGETLEDHLKNPKSWDADHPPGGYFRYANLNFPVVATVMEAATGERFDRLMTRLVFEPLKLDACFNWASSCSDRAVAQAVVLYDEHGAVKKDDLQGRRPPCTALLPDRGGVCGLETYRPGVNGGLFAPQGGGRISARDLAKVGQLVLNRGRGFLSPRSMALLTTPVWRFDGHNGDTQGGFFCAYGLAIQTLANRRPGCNDDPFGDGRPRIGHAGEAYGLKSGLWIDPVAGTGMVWIITAVPDDAPVGKSAFYEVEEAVIGR